MLDTRQSVGKLEINRLDIAVIVCVLATAAFTISTFVSFYDNADGPFRRMIPGFSTDHALLLVYSIAVLLATYFLNARWALGLSILPGLFFFTVIDVLPDLVFALTRFYAVFCAGYISSRAMKLPLSIPNTFAMGIFCSVIWIGALSFVGHVQFLPLLIFDLAAIAVALIMVRKEYGLLLTRLRTGISTKWFVPIVLMIFILVVTRTEAPLPFDPVWYSLHWLDSLTDGSLWASNGYVNAVHYYGKIQELSTGFLSFRSSPESEIIFVSLVVALSIYLVFDLFSVPKFSIGASLVLLTVSAPALTLATAMGKADSIAIATILIVLSVLCSETEKKNYVFIIFAVLVFLTSKPTYIVWGFLFSLIYIRKILDVDSIKRFWPAMIMGATSLAVMWARTYTNTGFVYVGLGPLIQIQNMLGLQGKWQFVNVDLGTLRLHRTDHIHIILQHLLDPGTVGGHALSWTGLGAISSLSVILIYIKFFSMTDRLRFFFVICFSFILIGLMNSPSNTIDGYYTFSAYCFLLILALQNKAVIEVRRDRLAVVLNGVLMSCASAVLFFGLYFTMWGNSFQTVDFVPPRSSGFEMRLERSFKAHDLSAIATILKDNSDKCRTLLVPSNRSVLRELMTLPCPMESWFEVTWQPPLNGRLFKDVKITEEYFSYANFDYLLLERSIFETAAASGPVISFFEAREIEYENGRWILYSFP